MRTKTATWFETKVRYRKMMENGTEKAVTETYVFDAMTWTEAESRVTEHLSKYISGEWEILAIGKAGYKEVVFDDSEKSDKFFKGKVNFITIDEKSGTEKKSAVMYLVQGESLEGARKLMDAMMGTSMIDYQIASLAETKIIDVVEVC